MPLQLRKQVKRFGVAGLRSRPQQRKNNFIYFVFPIKQLILLWWHSTRYLELIRSQTQEQVQKTGNTGKINKTSKTNTLVKLVKVVKSVWKQDSSGFIVA